jgi:exodeoxyribonuclease VII small subunit
MTHKTTRTYQELHNELEAVLSQLQQPDIPVDEAVRLYEKGLKLATAIDTHLQQAENVIKKLHVPTDGAVS